MMKKTTLSLLAALAFATSAAGQGAAPRSGHETPAVVQGVGVVKAVDLKAGAVTLAHEPIQALGWPAMTMAFRVSSPSLLARVKPGDKVQFELKGQLITALKPV